MNLNDVLIDLEGLADRELIETQDRFGINSDRALGISVMKLRQTAAALGTDHALAKGLWETEIHEGRILATMIDDPDLVTERQMEGWVNGIDSWDLCDQACNNLFRKTPHAQRKATEWLDREPEFVKRAGLVLIATMAVHAEHITDSEFIGYLQSIETRLDDDRHYVKKAASWAIREIGKRNHELHRAAITMSRSVLQHGSPPAKWVATDVLRELDGTREID